MAKNPNIRVYDDEQLKQHQWAQKRFARFSAEPRLLLWAQSRHGRKPWAMSGKNLAQRVTLQAVFSDCVKRERLERGMGW